MSWVRIYEKYIKNFAALSNIIDKEEKKKEKANAKFFS